MPEHQKESKAMAGVRERSCVSEMRRGIPMGGKHPGEDGQRQTEVVIATAAKQNRTTTHYLCPHLHHVEQADCGKGTGIQRTEWANRSASGIFQKLEQRAMVSLVIDQSIEIHITPQKTTARKGQLIKVETPTHCLLLVKNEIEFSKSRFNFLTKNGFWG